MAQIRLNSLTGDAGINSIRGLGGSDAISGGEGSDEAAYDRDADNGGLAAVTVDLNAGTATDGFGNTDTLISIERARGTAGADSLIGSAADNGFVGLAGNDTISGGAGIDELRYDVDFVFGGAAGVTVNLATGTATDGFGNTDALSSIENVRGTRSADIFIGGSANEVFYGLGGNDTITGGSGVDWVSYSRDILSREESQALIGVSVNLTSNTATDSFGNTDTLSSIENASGGTLGDALTGNAGDNAFRGFGGNDTINGLAGIDTIDYSQDRAYGDLVFSNGASAIIVNLGAGSATDGFGNTDTLLNIENAIGTEFNDALTGSANVNTLDGGLGNDTLDGGTGADTLDGGLGNDLYVVDNAGDQVNELAGEGIDTVRVGFSYTLGNEVENLELTGVGNANGTGNALNNRLAGNSGNNILKGAAGNDTLVGGSGNDTYFVDSTGDVVSEAFGQGTDTVFSSVSLSANLAANVENLTLSGTALTGTGNNLNNVLTGNAQNNTLNAAFGEDSMAGGFGNDTYVVENINDVVTENSNAGTDTIQATINIGALAVNVENLTLILGALEGTGNELANVLTGNANNNTLSGGAGFDQLSGGAGADTMIGGTDTDWYILDNVNDQVIENAGAAEGTADRMFTFVSNTIAANVETMTLMGGANIDGTGSGNADRLHGNTGNNTLNGLAGNDVMDGLAGDDRLIGGLGLDNMTGSAGADTFVYTSLADSGTTGATRDLIQDFAEGTDKIDVTAIDAIAGGIDDAFTFLGTGAFTGTAGQLRYFLVDNAGVANDFTLVELDGDGNAAADSQITLRGLHTLTSNEFVL